MRNVPAILDASGVPIQPRAYGDSAWNAASNGLELRNWNPPSGSADADNMLDQATIRDRARDLDRNEPLARGFLDSASNAVISTGLRCKPNPNWRVLGKSQEWAKEFRQAVRDVVLPHLDSTDIDATGHHNLGGLSALALRNMMMSGSCLGVFYYKRRPFADYQTTIRLVEADRLKNPNNGMDTDRLRGGIELDEFGEAVAYNVLKRHPGDMVGNIMGGAALEWERIPRYTPWGRHWVLHLFDRERIDQNYGISQLASVAPQFRNLGQYKTAELQAALANAMIAMVIESQGSFSDVKEMFGSAEDYFKARNKWNRGLQKGMGFGAVLPTMPGDKINSFLPQRPNAQAVAFCNFFAREIATGLGMPLETINHDWSGLNYSAARTVILDANRTYRIWRAGISNGLCQPVYENVFEEAVHNGSLPDVTPDNFYKLRRAWTRCEWGAPARGWVDELKEAQAAQLRMSLGLTNLSDECDAQGTDWLDNLDQREIEMQEFAARNVPYPPNMAPPGVRTEDPVKDNGSDQQRGAGNGDQ